MVIYNVGLNVYRAIQYNETVYRKIQYSVTLHSATQIENYKEQSPKRKILI